MFNSLGEIHERHMIEYTARVGLSPDMCFCKRRGVQAGSGIYAVILMSPRQ